MSRSDALSSNAVLAHRNDERVLAALEVLNDRHARATSEHDLGAREGGARALTR